jgi:hypothetical protein
MKKAWEPNQTKTWWNIPQNVGPNSNYIVPLVSSFQAGRDANEMKKGLRNLIKTL